MTADEHAKLGPVERVEHALNRIRRFLVSSGMVLAALAAAFFWLVKVGTADIRQQQTEIIRQLDRDSVQSERTLEIVQLSVVAVIEPPNSAARRAALAELRSRRRVR